MRKFTIGAVSIAEPCTRNSAGWRHADVYSDKRILFLRAFFRGEPLPEPYFVVAGGQEGYREITRDEVNWDTAGDRITK
jgi:hypothetical protein